MPASDRRPVAGPPARALSAVALIAALISGPIALGGPLAAQGVPDRLSSDRRAPDPADDQTAAANQPLSAIDWLSRSVATPVALPRPVPAEPPVAAEAAPETITVTPLGDTTLDALGLTPARRAGLARDLWGETPTEALVARIGSERADMLPGLRQLLFRLLTAELDPPFDAQADGRLYLARVDKLLDLGALDPAMELLNLPDEPRPEPFRRWFDVSLLLGEEDRACATMNATPNIAPTFPARIFCLARGGDWSAAALTLGTGEALGQVDAESADLLARFLDPELADGAEALPVPARVSPLVLRMMEAIGQPLPTATLPLAFAQSDLRDNVGWKARAEAAERLARTGAITPDQLFAIYAERPPAASGGVWDRIAAIRALDAALADGSDAIYDALPLAWTAMSTAELEVPFAEVYGEKLAGLGLRGEAGETAFRAGLLSPAYESVAQARAPADGVESFLIGLAKGDVTGLVQPDQRGAAVRAAFSRGAAPEASDAALLAGNRVGEAVLAAMEQITQGSRGDLREVTRGLKVLRAAGFEDTARRAALEFLLLERRG
ncbi:hypothetical protein V8J36_09765 [Frigidibacter sp. MR17.14]|uniref:hypothetical protein n=1 Tax=Frigidibacter sp. MR17.14 TaxID=3126509 RepID=UPI00301313A7